MAEVGRPVLSPQLMYLCVGGFDILTRPSSSSLAFYLSLASPVDCTGMRWLVWSLTFRTQDAFVKRKVPTSASQRPAPALLIGTGCLYFAPVAVDTWLRSSFQCALVSNKTYSSLKWIPLKSCLTWKPKTSVLSENRTIQGSHTKQNKCFEHLRFLILPKQSSLYAVLLLASFCGLWFQII